MGLEELARIALIAGILVCGVVYCSYFYEPYQETKELVVFATACIILGLLAIQLSRASVHERIPVLQTDVLYFLFLLTFFLSLPNAINVWETLYSALLFFCYGILFIFSARTFQEKQSRTYLSDSLVFLLAIISVYGIAQMMGFEFHPGIFPRQAVSSMGHESYAAHLMVLLLPLALSLCISCPGRRRYLYALAMVVGVIQLFFTAQRAAWLAVVVTCGVMYCFYFRKYLFRHGKHYMFDFTAIVIFLGSLYLYQSYSNPLSPFQFHNLFAMTTLKERFIYWINTLYMWADHPFFGIGASNFQFQYPFYWDRYFLDLVFNENIFIPNPHNEFIQLLTENGVFGFMFFIMLVIVCFRGPRTPRTDTRQEQGFLEGIWGGVMAALIHMIFSFNLHTPAAAMVFWVYLGVLAGNRWQVEEKGFEVLRGPFSNRHFCSALFVFAMAAYFCCLPFISLRFQSSYFQNKGSWFAVMEKYEDAADNFSRALESDNSRYEPYFQLASAYNILFRYRDSIKTLEKARLIHPYSPNLYFNLGYAYQHLGNPREALREYGHAMSLYPFYGKVYLGVASVYESLEQYDEARKWCYALIRMPNRGFRDQRKKYLDELRGEAYNNMSRYAELTGNTAEAVEYMEYAVNQAPHKRYLWQRLGILYQKDGRDAKALMAYSNAGLKMPVFRTEMFHKAVNIFETGDQGVAYRIFQAIADYYPGDGLAFYYLAITHYGWQQTTEAHINYFKFRNQWKGDPEKIRELERMLEIK